MGKTDWKGYKGSFWGDGNVVVTQIHGNFKIYIYFAVCKLYLNLKNFKAWFFRKEPVEEGKRGS